MIGERIKLVYTGMRLSQGIKKVKEYHYQYKENDHFKKMVFDDVLIKLSVGGIIEATHTEAGVKGKYDYVGVYEDTNSITEWMELDKMARLEFSLQKEMKSVNSREYDIIIENLNRIIKVLPPNQRNLFKYKLLNDLL